MSVDKNAKKIRLNLAAWSYADFIQFIGSFRKGENDVTFDLATRLIGSWDYPVDLAGNEPLMELDVAESGRVIKTVFETVLKFADECDIEGVTVDFSVWNTRRFLIFDDARRAGDVDKAVKMIHEICKMDGVSPDAELSFQNGATMFRAVNEAYKKVVSGKN